MHKYKNLLLYMLLIVLIINAVYSHIKIADLEDFIENTRTYTENQSVSLRNEINNIYQNVDAQLEKEASLLSHFEIKERDIDTAKHTLMIDLNVIPKELNELTKLTLQYKDETYTFKRNGDVFSVSFAADLFSSYEDKEYCFVKIENNDQTKIQKLEDIDLSNIYQRYLPNFTVFNFSEKEKTKENVVVNLELAIHTPPVDDASVLGYKKYELVTEINGKIKTQNITEMIKKQETYHDGIIHISNKLKLNATDKDEVNVYIEAIDTLGYSHSCLIYSTNDDFDAKEENEGIIKDKEGTILAKQE